MKSLGKALEVLEYVVCNNGKAVTPSEAAKACDMNVSSCVRIFKMLTAQGYMVQVSRRSGYIAGPAIISLGDRNSIYGKMEIASIEPLKVLANNIGGIVNLSVYHQKYRYIIAHLGSEEKLRLVDTLRYKKDYFDSATGQLLLSTLKSDELNELIVELGLPKSINTQSELELKLAKIRKDKYTSFWSETQQRWIVGSLIIASGFPPSAIGFGVCEEKDVKQAIKWSQETADGIKENLNEVKIYSY